MRSNEELEKIVNGTFGLFGNLAEAKEYLPFSVSFRLTRIYKKRLKLLIGDMKGEERKFLRWFNRHSKEVLIPEKVVEEVKTTDVALVPTSVSIAVKEEVSEVEEVEAKENGVEDFPL